MKEEGMAWGVEPVSPSQPGIPGIEAKRQNKSFIMTSTLWVL
jgi:hypothetical protein